jgi:8-oxo-dGTP diphosphatase
MPVSEQGVNLEHFMLIPRVLLFLTRGNDVLLLKGAKDKRLWAGLYNGIGGHIEQGESIIAAVNRELYEETGQIPQNLWLCGIITIDTQTNPGVLIFVFKGESTGGNPISSNEGLLEWVEQSRLVRLPLVGDLPTLLPKIIAMKQGDFPFFAHSSYNEIGKIVVSFL